MVDEIQFLYEEKGREYFFFTDELFTHNPKRIEDICNRLIEKGLNEKIRWRTFARVDDVAKDKIDLALMKKAGMNGIFYGIESMNPITLQELKKGTTPEQNIKAIEDANKNNIDVWGSLMIGYPWESEQELRKSLETYLDIARDGEIKHTYTAFITPFPGTPFHNKYKHLIIDPDYLMSDCFRPILDTPIDKEILTEIYNGFLEKIKKQEDKE